MLGSLLPVRIVSRSEWMRRAWQGKKCHFLFFLTPVLRACLPGFITSDCVSFSFLFLSQCTVLFRGKCSYNILCKEAKDGDPWMKLASRYGRLCLIPTKRLQGMFSLIYEKWNGNLTSHRISNAEFRLNAGVLFVFWDVFNLIRFFYVSWHWEMVWKCFEEYIF